ncbi:MAG: hypothetical protein WDO24_05955 [Pseudomonadota bacterium]
MADGDHSIVTSRQQLARYPATDSQAIVQKHARALYVTDEPISAQVGPATRLIPKTELPTVIEALERRVQPASERKIKEIMLMFGGAWPSAFSKADPTAVELFTLQLGQDLSEFPADILEQTLVEMRTTLKFAPSIAEIYQVAKRLASPRHAQLRLAKAHGREHARREQEQRERAERERLDLDRRIKRAADLVAIYGEACFVEPEVELFHAERGMCWIDWRRAADWNAALNAGEPWAMAALHVAAAFDVSRELSQHPAPERRIGPAQARDLLHLARTDAEWPEVREVMRGIGLGHIAPIPVDERAPRDKDGPWRGVERVAASIIAELRSPRPAVAPTQARGGEAPKPLEGADDAA